MTADKINFEVMSPSSSLRDSYVNALQSADSNNEFCYMVGVISDGNIVDVMLMNSMEM